MSLKSSQGYFLDSIRCRRLTLGRGHWLGGGGVHQGVTFNIVQHNMVIVRGSLMFGSEKT